MINCQLSWNCQPIPRLVLEVRASVEQTDYSGKAQKKRRLDARPTSGKTDNIKDCSKEIEVEEDVKIENDTRTSKVTLEVAPVFSRRTGQQTTTRKIKVAVRKTEKILPNITNKITSYLVKQIKPNEIVNEPTSRQRVVKNQSTPEKKSKRVRMEGGMEGSGRLDVQKAQSNTKKKGIGKEEETDERNEKNDKIVENEREYKMKDDFKDPLSKIGLEGIPSNSL